MKVLEILCRPVSTCSEDTTLSAAARLMEENDCGVLPVLRASKVVGVVTDRDVCVAVGRKRNPQDVPVREIMSRDVASCGVDDDVRHALSVMASSRVRRLPAIDSRGKLEGIVSIDDVVLRAEEPDPSRGAPEISCRDVVTALRAICGSRRVRLAASLSAIP